MTRITIDVPDVPYPGDRTTAAFFRTAARNLRGKESPGGSNVRSTVAVLLERTAHALDGEDVADFGRDPLRLAPDAARAARAVLGPAPEGDSDADPL